VKPLARRFLGFAATALLVVLWAVLLRPTALGGPTTYVVVRGTSMLPTYDTGDLVVVRAADSYGPGDIVAYRVPDGDVGEGRIVIHRIVAGDPTAYVLEGDNNDSVDPWTPRAADILGKAWIGIPSVGRVLALLHQPVTLGALAAALVVTLLLARPVRRLPDERARQLGRWGAWRTDSSAASAASSSRSEAR